MRSGHRAVRQKNANGSAAKAACSDGMAATEFTVSCPFSSRLPAACRPSTSQPRAVARSTGPMYPSFDASHGGAAGQRMYVVRPMAVREKKRLTQRTQRSRLRHHNHPATTNGTIRWDV